MIKDLTTLKWRKNIYYVTDNTIFDIAIKQKKDLDDCGTQLIDFSKLPEKFQKAATGLLLDIREYPEAYIEHIPSIKLSFKKNEEVLNYYFPLQYLIEDGDKIIEGKAIQTHPNVFDNKYVNKYNNEIFNYIKDLVKGKNIFNNKNVSIISTALPDWLEGEGQEMTKNYIEKYFIKGNRYSRDLAFRNSEEGIYKYLGAKIGDYKINIWTEEVIDSALKAFYAERIINNYYNSEKLTIDSMENLASSIKYVEDSESGNPIKTFLNIDYNNNASVKFESLCINEDIDTYFEYLKKRFDTSKFFSMINNEYSYNQNFVERTALWMYYSWSDQANAPYKEDLWNTVKNRAANINDARKNELTGEYELDAAGNYIYDNCVRCWKGAVGAPGAKYPWITFKYEEETPVVVIFKYTYPDGTVKTVKPWGDKLFGGSTDNPRRVWGVASVAQEFGDNDFLLEQNRTDGKSSTFDINRFEIVLV